MSNQTSNENLIDDESNTFQEANPYTPGAGHSPPYLAGREVEISSFRKHLHQEQILNNVVLTGLRGTGKTVLMEDKYKPIAQNEGWAWVGSDFSESSFLSESNLCLRLLTDLAVFTSCLSVESQDGTFGFNVEKIKRSLSFDFLLTHFESQPGLTVDKLKSTLELVWPVAKSKGTRGIVFAYDEAQVVQDRPDKEQYPLAVLLETFQSLQRKGAKYFLLLTGLPTLFPRLVESRTYAERMFAIQELGRLSPKDSREAIEKPLRKTRWKFSAKAIESIIEKSDGYPYFIQFICRETLDHIIAHPQDCSIPMEAIIRKLDSDFFAGRWENVTDRQRELLFCIASLSSHEEFSIAEIVECSKKEDFTRLKIKPFASNDVSQMLPRLIEKGLVYKNRLGKYCFAVPLFSDFICRRFFLQEGVLSQKALFQK
ncbi:MAG: ATP-binding protein [Pirellulaceae bacterium]|nr:ATP-binding protein [Pirellulaceae bacterium]